MLRPLLLIVMVALLLLPNAVVVISVLPPEVLPDFSRKDGGKGYWAAQQGIDPWAVPNVIVAGVAKGGSTDIWNVIEAYHDDFLARGIAEGNPLDLEKEFNLPFTSGDYISHPDEYPCPAEALTAIMKCPRQIMKNDQGHEHDHGGRNFTKCLQWLDGQPPEKYKTRIAPKYTMDAYPYLMRNSHEEMRNILILNSNDTNCRKSTKNSRRPLVISLTRDPYNRVISYYNYFLLRSAAEPLESMLGEEISTYATNAKIIPLIRALEMANYTSFTAHLTPTSSTIGLRKINGVYPVTAHEAHFFIHTWEMLRAETKRALAFQKQQHLGKNYEAEGILLDNMYLPQILGLLFPLRPDDKDRSESENTKGKPYTGARRMELPYPLLVLQSELLFAHMRDVFEQVLVPYFHANDARAMDAVLRREKRVGMDETKIYTNSRSGKYDARCTLSAAMQCRLYSFYFRINANFVSVLYRLQQTGRIVVAPRIRSPQDVWWSRQLPACQPSP